MPEPADAIAAAPVFAGLEARHVATIAACGRDATAPAGAYLFHAGSPADGCYLIREGAIALEVEVPGRGAAVVETLHEHDVVGWSWLFAPYRWQFDGRVTEAAHVVAFDGDCLRRGCEADHELGYELMRRFAGAAIQRLQAARLQALDVYARR